MNKHLLRIIALISIVLAGCNTNAGTVDISINETSAEITEVTDELVHMNNCGGKGEVSQTAERSKSVNVEFSRSLSNTLGIETASINREVSAKYGEVYSSAKKIELVAPAGTNMEFNLKWTEKTWLGIVLVQGKDEQGKYKVSVPISVELVNSQDLGCSTSHATLTNPTKVPSTPTPSNSASRFIEKLTIPANLELGINYKASNTGIYTFKYIDSSFTAYAGCWSTRIVAYPGSVPQKDEKNSLFGLGDAVCATSKKLAIERTKEEIAYIRLNSGDVITLVIGDSYWLDNVGSITLEIYFTPQ